MKIKEFLYYACKTEFLFFIFYLVKINKLIFFNDMTFLNAK